MATITFGNFKGGVGKTTAACMASIILSQKGYRTLHIDLDPQADSTEFLSNVFDYELPNNYTSLYEAIEQQQSLVKTAINLTDNLSLLPSGIDLIGFEKLAIEQTKVAGEGMEHFLLDALLEEAKSTFDYLIIDVPPTLNIYNSSALITSDWVIPIMKTQRKSFNATIKYLDFINDINNLRQQYDYPSLKILGILPYLQKKSSPLDTKIVVEANEHFKGKIMENAILERERIKRYDEEGFDLNQMDMHDKAVFTMYGNVIDEIIEKVGENDE